jgi:hypothetical protein
MNARSTWLIPTLALLVSCSRPSDSTDAKRSPKPPPGAGVTAPAALHVDVDIDGVPAPPIDAARLGAAKPDFADDEHRAWRIATLVGPAAARPGVVVAVGDKGVSLEMRTGGGPGDSIPVLSLNRRGEVVVGLVSADDPFPDFHGKGGRLARPGDPLPRMASPVKLRIAAGASAAGASTVGTGARGGGGEGGGAGAHADAAPLKVVVTGGESTSWPPEAFDAVPRFTIHSDGSERDAWSLRDIAHKLVGPRARITMAVDGDGTRDRIDAKDWSDAKKTPVLRINRRGMYKIEWVDQNGNMTNDDDVRDVRSVEVAPSG